MASLETKLPAPGSYRTRATEERSRLQLGADVQPVAKDAASKLEAFIPSVLDDAGLSPAEFRVFCRVKRRGECTEGIPNIAAGCKLNRDTVWDALARLVELGMVSRSPRPGASTVFRALPPSDWKTPSGKGGAAEKEGRPSKPGDTQRKRGGDYPAEKEGHEGNPIKGNPIKAISSNKPVASAFGMVRLTPEGARTVALMERCRQVFGDGEMKRSECHKRWYERARDEWSKLDAVLNDTVSKIKEHGLTNPAAWAESLWKQWPSRN